QTFFIFFSGSPPTETAKYVDPSYTTAHVTFFARNHKGDNIARIIKRCQEFMAANPMDKANFKLAGGLIGVLAAANEELVRNDLLMNFLGFGTIYIIVLFTYRSWAAGVYLLAPLFISNVLINAAMAVWGIGINVNTLPLVTVGVGFGIDYGLYILSRIIEEIRVNGDLELSIRAALVTSAQAARAGGGGAGRALGRRRRRSRIVGHARRAGRSVPPRASGRGGGTPRQRRTLRSGARSRAARLRGAARGLLKGVEACAGRDW